MEETLKQRLTKIGTEILTASRNELYISMRFLDIALHRLSYEMYVATLTVGTDGEQILYNPRYLFELYREDPICVNRAYMHMLLHCLFRHMMTREEREIEKWNLACDIAVESMIDSMEFATLKQTISDEKQQIYDKLGEKLSLFAAEAIYRELSKEQLPLEELLRMEQLFVVDDHSIWENMKEDRDPEDESEHSEENDNQESNKKESSDQSEDSEEQEQSEQEFKQQQMQQRMTELQKQWKEISEKVGTNLDTVSRTIGQEAGNLVQQLHVKNREQYSYREFLQKFAVVSEEMKVDNDAFDYIYYTYGLMNYENMPFIEPLEYKEEKKIEEFVIAIDTSGSCSGELVEAFLQQTYTILSDAVTFGKKRVVYLIQCDKEIQEVICLASLEELKDYMENFVAKGFGGTDFRPVFHYIDQLMEEGKLTKLRGMLYFTDGHGVYPERAPRYEVAFVFMGEELYKVEVPYWAMKLVIDQEEFK